MPLTDLVYEVLKADLSASRTLLPQVVDYIANHYNCPSSEFPQFFSDKFPTLEDYEVDLIFSPQFTPAEHNRLEYIPILGAQALSPSEIGLLKKRLLDENLEILMKTPDAQVEITVPVHEVFIDRYVNLLKLDQALPAVLHEAIVANVPSESRNEMNLLARDDVWRSSQRQDILVAFLQIFNGRHNFSVPKVSFFTGFLRTYRPAHLFDLERQFDSLIRSCEVDMENVAGRGFHDEYLKALNVGNNLTKGSEQDIWAHYRRMMELTKALKDDFQHLQAFAPEIAEKAKQEQPV